MTRILRDDLSALADEGVDRMASADDLAAVMSVRFAHARRRRPAIIAGTTCLLLVTAGAAAAGVSLLSAEFTELPDRIATGAAAPAAPTGLRCGRELGDVWPTWEPMMLRNSSAENATVGVFDASQNDPDVMYPEVSLDSASTVDLDVTRDAIAGLYLVQDDTVVAHPGPVGTTIDETIEHGVGRGIRLDRPTMCDGTPAPDGTYEAYGSLEVTVHDGEYAGTYDIVGGPWTVELGPPVAPPRVPEQPGIPGLTSIDREASSLLQCGAPASFHDTSTGTSGSDDRSIDPPIGWRAADDPAGMPVDASGRSTISVRTEVVGGTATGYPTTAPAFVIVTDGVVVGTSSPDGPTTVPATGPADLDTQGAVSGSVLYRACSGGVTDAGPLPAGLYSIWATQRYHLTERAAPAAGGGALVTRVVDEDVDAYGRVADLWIGLDGRPVPSAGPADGWPAAVPPEVAFAGSGGELSVAWIPWASSTDDAYRTWQDAGQDLLAEAGYSSAPMLLACQPRAARVLNLPPASIDATGLGVIFATRADADTFAALFQHPTTIVQGAISCDAT